MSKTATHISYIVTNYKYKHRPSYDEAAEARRVLEQQFPKKKFRIMKILNVDGDPDLAHASDCALHNEPALPAGPCNCGLIPTQGQDHDR